MKNDNDYAENIVKKILGKYEDDEDEIEED